MSARTDMPFTSGRESGRSNSTKKADKDRRQHNRWANVVVILTDQQRQDSLGAYGSSYAQTPNLDALAQRGVHFSHCYVANPICMPSRASIFTGLYPRNHRTWTNGVMQPQELYTLGHHLATEGYATSYIGKAHFNPFESREHTPEAVTYWNSESTASSDNGGEGTGWSGPYWGFEHAELCIGHTLPLAHYGVWFHARGGTDDMLEVGSGVAATAESAPGGMDPQHESGVTAVPEALHSSSFVAERAAAEIGRLSRGKEPFCLVASFPDPHHPFDPPAEVAERFSGEGVPEPIGGPVDLKTRPEHYRDHLDGAWSRRGVRKAQTPGGLGSQLTAERIRLTHGMVALIDQGVGRILRALSEQGVDENTYVVFASDHGELLGDHGLWFKGPFYYDKLINVPFIVSGPGIGSRAFSENNSHGTSVPGGSENQPRRARENNAPSHSLVSLVDLFPTVCDLLGLEVPSWTDGVSHAPELLGWGVSSRSRCLIEYRNGFGPKMDRASFALCDSRYTFVVYQGGERELTDRHIDPEERVNCADDPAYVPTVRYLESQILQELTATSGFLPPQVAFA